MNQSTIDRIDKADAAVVLAASQTIKAIKASNGTLAKALGTVKPA